MLNKILNVLEQKGISKAELAQKAGIKERTLYHILESEENFQKCAYKTVKKILCTLKIDGNFIIIAGNKIYHLNEETFNVVLHILSKFSGG